METIKAACPICHGDVTGDEHTLYFCSSCSLLYKRDHLQLSKEQVEVKVKAKVIERYTHTDEHAFHLDMEKRALKSAKRPVKKTARARR